MHLGVSGRSWFHLCASGRIWAQLGVSGGICVHLGLSGRIWTWWTLRGSGRVWALKKGGGCGVRQAPQQKSPRTMGCPADFLNHLGVGATWRPGTLGGGGGALGTQGPQGALVLFLFVLMYEGGRVGECGGDARTWVVN